MQWAGKMTWKLVSHCNTYYSIFKGRYELYGFFDEGQESHSPQENRWIGCDGRAVWHCTWQRRFPSFANACTNSAVTQPLSSALIHYKLEVIKRTLSKVCGLLMWSLFLIKDLHLSGKVSNLKKTLSALHPLLIVYEMRNQCKMISKSKLCP